MAVRRFDIEAGGDEFAFLAETEPKIDFWLGKYPADKKRSAVIPLLWLAQKDNQGWLSEPAMRAVADRLDMPYIRVYEVATFYTMFRLQPVGKYHIQLCGTTPCMLRGANDLKDVCVDKIGERMFVTDDGKLSWEEVECLGACVNAPMAQINDDYFEDLTPESFGELIDRLRNGAPVEPGPQIERLNSEPVGGTQVLTEAALFDGTMAKAITLPNMPGAPEPEPDSKALPRAEAPTNVGREEPTAEKLDAAAAEAPDKVEQLPGEKPAAIDLSGTPADDLKRISGIGPKNEDQLNAFGVFTFAQIADWSAENVDWVEGYLSFPGRIDRENWIEQARALASGGDTAFSRRVDAGEVASSKDEDE